MLEHRYWKIENLYWKATDQQLGSIYRGTQFVFHNAVPEKMCLKA